MTCPFSVLALHTLQSLEIFRNQVSLIHKHTSPHPAVGAESQVPRPGEQPLALSFLLESFSLVPRCTLD